MSDNKKKILIIEDDASLNKALSDKLNKEEFDVISVDSGERGWEEVKNKPDLVLLDLMLPGIPGEQILKKMNEEGLIKDVPVIVLSAKGNDANLQNCLDGLCASDYLVKSESGLIDVVNKIKKYIK